MFSKSFTLFFTFAEKYVEPNRRSGRIAAVLWGWMASCGPGALVPIHERLNGMQYADILEEVLIPSVRMLLVPEPLPIFLAMDNSSVRNSKPVTKWL